MLNTLKFGILFLLMWFASCNGSAEKYADSAAPEAYDEMSMKSAEGSNAYENTESGVMRMMQVEVAPEPENNEIRQEIIKKKIIKEGSMELHVKKIKEAKHSIDTLVAKLGGYYGNETYNDYGSSLVFSLTVRVPQDKFEALVNGTESGIGEVKNKNIAARDVTEQFVDLESRLNTKKVYLEQYRSLLSKANRVSDMLEIEREIRTITEEIESTQGRLKYLTDQVNYSTLTLTLTQVIEYKYEAEARDSFWERLKEGVSGGWYGLIDFIIGVFSMWPFWLVVGAGWYFAAKWWKKRKLNKQN